MTQIAEDSAEVSVGHGLAATGPDPETARRLEQLLDVPPPREEHADLAVIGWSPSYLEPVR